MALVESVLRNAITTGTLEVVEPDNATKKRYGSGDPVTTLQLRRPNALKRILRNPYLNLGETYMDEEWDVKHDDLTGFLRVLRANFEGHRSTHPLLALFKTLLASWNSVKSSIRNVSHHYNLDDDLFEGFLDADMHYSCAYFEDSNTSLEAAQQAKCDHLLKKLRLRQGARVLDIGCGWGSLAMYIAEHADVEVVGITLSESQKRVADERCMKRSLSNQVSFHLEDYREHRGSYDGVVSVGMFEHVGKPHFRSYFKCVEDLLKPDGIAVLHTIGHTGKPEPTNPWIEKYIFPGGYIPTLSEVSAAIEKTNLVTSDVEVWRRHYASTLEAWNERFQSLRRDFVERKGERFCRMWEFYLTACQTAFELADLVVFQIQLGRQNDTVPLTREYLYS